MMDDKIPVIKTYSRRKPLTVFVPSSAWVPSHPTDFSNVRESRLNDKTLVVEDFDATFDRLAKGVKFPSLGNSLSSTDDNGDDEDHFKVPSPPPKRVKTKSEKKKFETLNQEKLKSNLFNEDLSNLKENEIKTEKNKKNGLKRKKDSSESSDEDFHLALEDDEQAAGSDKEVKKSKRVPNKKKKISPKNKTRVKLRECNVSLQKLNAGIPTSTPRDHKLRMIVDMQNISPIKLDKENIKNNEQYSRFSITRRKPLQTKVSTFGDQELMLNNETSILSETISEFVKPHTRAVKSLVRCNNSNKNEFGRNAEATLDNAAEKTPAINEDIADHSIAEFISAEDANKQSLNITPISSKGTQNIRSVESPLLFDDTFDDKNQTSNNHLISSVKENENKKDFTKNLSINVETINHENENLDVSNSDSSFSPHDWSNDYDSSFDYFIENENIEQNNSANLNKDHNLKEMSGNNFSDANDSKEEERTLLSSSSKGSIKDKTCISDLKNLDNTLISDHDDSIQIIAESKYVTLRNVEKQSIENGQKEVDITNLDEKSIENISIMVEKNFAHTGDEQTNKINFEKSNNEENDSFKDNDRVDIFDKEKSLTVEENIIASGDEQINQENFEQSNNNKANGSLKSTDRVEIDDKTNKLDKKLYGQEPVVLISKIDVQNLDNQSFIMTRNISNKENRTNLIQESQNNDQSNVNKKINDQITETNSPIISKKILKKGYKKNTKTKSKTAKNKFNKIRNKEKNIKIDKADIENSIFQKENNSMEKSENDIISTLKKNEIDPMLISKDLRVVLSKLDNSNIQNKSLSLSKKKLKQKTRKSTLRKSGNASKSYNEKESSIENNEKVTDIKSTDDFNNQESNSIHYENINSPQKITTKNSEMNEDTNKSLNGEDLCVLLSKLNDPVKITMRKNTYKKWDRPLTAITEDQIEKSLNYIEEEDEKNETSDFNKQYQNLNNDLRGNSVVDDHETVNTSIDNRKSQPIFLKPGKSWARSLSIINHFHNGQNLDEFAVGRGQNWRHSVQTILNMQPEGAAQSNIKTNEEEREHSFAIPSSIQRESNRISTVMTSPSRFSRRFSIRIIPSGTRSTLTDDFVNSRTSTFIADRTRKTSIARKTSLRSQRDTLVETEDDLIKSAKDIILKRCKQTTYLPFGDCFPDSYIEHCRKIGEGVYGEVFLYESSTEKSVIKIIPIEGDELVNCEPQKKFHEILSEIIIAEELHKLRFGDEFNTSGFVGVNRIMCVIGKYPDKLIDLWNVYDEEKKSENDCPSMFDDQQLYIILELAHGGQDLEAYVFQNASESYSIFIQTAFTLAVAEQSLEFEHRDLHWGNILISKTDDAHSIFKLGNEQISIPVKGVKVSVIDFTLSRMSYKGCKIFNDLAADPSLFTAQGEYQFDIYRMMRDNVNNDWQQFNPFTNILWLDYTLDKMITAARYKKKTTKIHKTNIDEMKQLRKEIFKYKSAFELVSNCEKIKIIAKTHIN